MNFDSHTSGVLVAAVEVVNLLTPGWTRGREYLPAADVAAVRAALRPGTWEDREHIPAEQVAEFAGYAGRLRAVFEHLAGERMDAACNEVNALLAETGAVPVLARHDGEPWHLHFHAIHAPWARSWAASMSTALAIVLGNPEHERLGVCRAELCDRVYLDTSRNGTRRFCSLACQNRVKAAAYRERRGAGH